MRGFIHGFEDEMMTSISSGKLNHATMELHRTRRQTSSRRVTRRLGPVYTVAPMTGPGKPH
jgi:hypothetical protein